MQRFKIPRTSEDRKGRVCEFVSVYAYNPCCGGPASEVSSLYFRRLQLSKCVSQCMALVQAGTVKVHALPAH